MGLIRRYGEFPALFVPDEGEVVLAARSPAGPFLRAVVINVRRSAEDFIRVSLVWLEGTDTTPTGKTVSPGTRGNVYVHRDDQVPLIRRVPVK